MSTVYVEETRIKELFKQSMVELLEERKDLFYDLFSDVIEDFALANAIREGENTETVSRADIFREAG